MSGYASGSNNGNGARGNFRQPLAAASKGPSSAAPVGDKAEVVFTSGLFAPDKEGSASKGSVKVKETFTVEAGSYINIYGVDRTKDNDPVLRIRITAPKRQA